MQVIDMQSNRVQSIGLTERVEFRKHIVLYKTWWISEDNSIRVARPKSKMIA